MLDVNKVLLNTITGTSELEKHNLWAYMYALNLEKKIIHLLNYLLSQPSQIF